MFRWECQFLYSHACANDIMPDHGQYMEHLADDVLPVILRRAFAIAQETAR